MSPLEISMFEHSKEEDHQCFLVRSMNQKNKERYQPYFMKLFVTLKPNLDKGTTGKEGRQCLELWFVGKRAGGTAMMI